MAGTKLNISGPAKTEVVPLNPKGATLGRGTNCDVLLDDNAVSRVHARIFQDPFGRWIVEDMKSRNGVFVDGQPVKAQAVEPGQKIEIAPFALSLSEESGKYETAGGTIRTEFALVDKGMEENIVSYRPDQATILSPALVQHINEITDRLLDLSSPSELYPEACQCLAQMLDTLIAIVRLPGKDEPLPMKPDILASFFGKHVSDAAEGLHLSKRVLDAIRTKDDPVMARSGPSDKHMVLTVVDESSPHVVYAARVNTSDNAIDVLYLDILESKSPDEMFDFIEAIARQINLAQKNLFFVELQKKERALREANTQLKEKDRIKDEYVARVTHDIKGHLAAMTSCLHIAADQSTGPLNEKQSDFLGRSRRRTGQLTDFVKELLNLTQMRLSGKFETAPFALSGSISHALGQGQRMAEDKSITVTSNIEPGVGMIVGNQFSINEMVANLLLNAIKYTPNGKTVHIEVKDLGEQVQIDVADTGIGIPADQVDHVFDEFFRATNAKSSEKDGTGLGLSLVKQIVDRHGGTISVQSKEGEGTTFTVILLKGNID